MTMQAVMPIKIGMSWILTRCGTEDRRMLQVKLPIRTVSTTNQRWNWRARNRMAKAQRTPVGLVVKAMLARDPQRLPVYVTLVRIAPRQLDDDNLRGALKSIRDGVADAFGLDDRDSSLRWLYDQRPGGVREYAVEISIVTVERDSRAHVIGSAAGSDSGPR